MVPDRAAFDKSLRFFEIGCIEAFGVPALSSLGFRHQERLRPRQRCDSIWDMLAARQRSARGVGWLSGGLRTDELERSGAARVYGDPADLLSHLDEVAERR